MFLIGLFSLAAVGGAAYAISDVFTVEEPDEDDEDRIEEAEAEDIPTGNLLEDGENVDEPAEADFDDPKDEEPSEGEVDSNLDGDLVIESSNEPAGMGGEDLINPFDGDDLIDGGSGNDILYGGGGADVMSGGEGHDILHGEDDDDMLAGDAGDDALFGHLGDDDLHGSEGDDRLYGGQGDDSLQGGDGDDALQGGDGNDHLSGGAGEDTLFGGDGDDVLTGADDSGDFAADFLNGGAGDDFILTGAGDSVTGGEGEDNIALDTAAEDDPDPVTIMDFQVGQDKLLVTWDQPDAPDIKIEAGDATDSVTRVMIDGQEIARLLGAEGLSPADIQLVTEAQLAQFAATG